MGIIPSGVKLILIARITWLILRGHIDCPLRCFQRPFCVNPLEYLAWLRSLLESRSVTILPSIRKEFGKSSCRLTQHLWVHAVSLIGVEDSALFPIRGQSIIVERNGLDRGHLPGYVGFKRMFERCSALEPCLKEGKKVLKHSVGLRPDKESGPCVEIRRISLPPRQS
ncbi:uncharacterized protein EDB93DRAFT_919286 [Suillus bovinus]|uniref:uncharacterized protein n=1 Tax=Suillus bovinus TaxID=48563 RepID=UPI001B87B0EF|nr:uncharacterized protein EDB93DRAFT_919286 [Suillus bovinus]KAG2156549.1 hypothetical protein EDB93DRAFT_919286 [Suillus bovinus]